MDAGGRRPVHLAGSNLPALELLLSADPDAAAARADHDLLPIHFATSYGDVPCTQRLLAAAPASLYARDAWGCLPVHRAALGGNARVLRHLLSRDPSLSAREDEDGSTPLDLALEEAEEATELEARQAALAVARVLLEYQDPLALAWTLSQHEPAVCAPLFADLAALRALDHDAWSIVPPLASLAAALPAVLARSEREAGQLVRRLPEQSRRRLQTFALVLGRLQRRPRFPALPAEIVTRLLSLFGA